MRRLLALPSAIILSGFAATAHAEATSASLKSNGDFDRSELWVNHGDCLADRYRVYSVALGNDNDLEIWAGAGCENAANREKDRTECWLVKRVDVPSRDFRDLEVRIGAREIVARNTSLTTGTEVPAVDGTVCDENPAELDFSLYFIQPDNSGQAPQGTIPTLTGYNLDTQVPPAPANVQVRSGERSVRVSWNAVDDAAQGYAVYCNLSAEPPPSIQESDAVNCNEDAGSDAAVECDNTTATPVAPVSATSSACPPGELRAGSFLPDVPRGVQELRTSTTSGTVGNFTNGREYACAVVSRDEHENQSELSSVGCATPEEKYDFAEVYERAGGQGGGGFCAMPVRLPDSRKPLALFMLAGVAVVLRKRVSDDRS